MLDTIFSIGENMNEHSHWIEVAFYLIVMVAKHCHQNKNECDHIGVDKGACGRHGRTVSVWEVGDVCLQLVEI